MSIPFAPGAYIEWGPITLVCVLFVIALPLIVLAFYVLRLGVRRTALLAKIAELNLEPEYLRVYSYDSYRRITQQETDDGLRRLFNDAFAKQFRGDNLFFAYLPPLLLLLLTTGVFVGIIIQLWSGRKDDLDFLNHAALFAMVGALVYVYPQLVQRYASLSLNPQAVYELVGSLWLSVFVGVVFANLADDKLKPVAAFVGSMFPIPAFAFVKRKLLTEKTDQEKAEEAAQASLLEILDQDRNLYNQLSYIGIRSVKALAFENPLRIFVEADPNLVYCIDLVDQANLYLLASDPEVRRALGLLGIRSAIDLTTQIYEELPSLGGSGGREWRFLQLLEPCPPYMVKPLERIAAAMKMDGIETLRNSLVMLSENPQLAYLQNLWVLMSGSVEDAFEAQSQLVQKLKGGGSGQGAGAVKRPAEADVAQGARVGRSDGRDVHPSKPSRWRMRPVGQRRAMPRSRLSSSGPVVRYRAPRSTV
jgi:hypothetical protein